MKIKTNSKRALNSACLIISAFLLFTPWQAIKADDIRDIVFPIIGNVRFSDDFGAPRVGHTHAGNDIFGVKMQQLVAAQDGYLSHVPFPEPYYGYSVFLDGDDGYDYWYLHMNNDNPGTDDGLGGGINAYAYDIESRNPVTKGQLIGYIGDSGNAEQTSPHLHFEIHRSDGNVINPYQTLIAAQKIAGPIFHPPMPGEILPFQKFQGGANIARGDVNLNSYGQEIIIGAASGGGPHVRVLDQNGNVENQFFAYAKTFRGGISVAAADLDGDGVAEIITGAGLGGGPHVRIFNRKGVLQRQFFAYAETFRNGIDVTAKPATSYSSSRIITGAGPGGGPHVRIFDRRGQVVNQFFAFDENFRGGVNVDVGNIYESSRSHEIAVVPASQGGPQIRIYSEKGILLDSEQSFETWWHGGYDIAAGEGVLTISTQVSARRTSVRTVIK